MLRASCAETAARSRSTRAVAKKMLRGCACSDVAVIAVAAAVIPCRVCICAAAKPLLRPRSLRPPLWRPLPLLQLLLLQLIAAAALSCWPSYCELLLRTAAAVAIAVAAATATDSAVATIA